MKKQCNFSLICSLLCAGGSFWFAVAEMLVGEDAVPRRVVRVFLWLASCGVWTANLVMNLYARKTAGTTETYCIEEIEEENFHE